MSDIYYEINAEETDVFRSRYKLSYSGRSESNLQHLAEMAAQNYHDRYDGWEADWPVTVALYDGFDGNEFGRFEVARIMLPQFSCLRKLP